MAVFTDSTRLPIGQATVLTESELLALFDRGAGIDKLVERLIDILDAADAASEDLEDGHDAELDFEGEATLGAPEQHHNQSKWGRTQVDGDGELELSLGAPERHPNPMRTFGDRWTARGGANAQTDWSAGSRSIERDEGEAEPGYDLPEGDEEWDGEGEDAEPSLGAANNHHNQTDWAQGSVSDAELVNEEGIARQSAGLDLQDILGHELIKG